MVKKLYESVLMHQQLLIQKVLRHLQLTVTAAVLTAKIFLAGLWRRVINKISGYHSRLLVIIGHFYNYWAIFRL